MNQGTPLPLVIYRAAARFLSPAAHLLVHALARAVKEAPSRLAERFGKASIPRPSGELIWIHGASVGECLSVLPLIDKLLQKPDPSILATSGTTTSAALMRERLPER